MRYTDQHHAIPVEYSGQLDEQMVTQIRRSFDESHERLYGYCQPDSPAQIVNLLVTAVEDRETVLIAGANMLSKVP